MYTISNTQRAEIMQILSVLSKHKPGESIKTYNVKRRAKNAIIKLQKAKHHEAIQ